MGTAPGFGRSKLLLAVACAWCMVVQATAHADIATCSYTAATHTAGIAVTPDTTHAGTGMFIRPTDGHLMVNSGVSTTQCGTATRTNTDTITVTGTGPAPRGAIFRLGTSVPFSPGFTDEPGSSDEIEMSFDFSSGGRWYLTPSGTSSPVPLDLALGGNLLNLNAGETDGVDADALVTGPYNVFVEGSVAADRILANGSAGTGGQPLAARMVASTSAGADLIVGGKRGDDLSGGLDPDVIFGGKGKDSLKGEGGIDRLFGQAGNDKLLGGPATDRLNGGSGQGDSCTIKHDRHRRCELAASDKK
jgi:RTX calcium-binding nonapeptide repeat (4 copies)